MLPLTNRAGDLLQDWFAEGMTDEIISELARIAGLRVISHQSVARYRGTTMSIPEIARALRVGAVLEGSTVAEGSSVRIHLQLVRPNPERHVWAEVFEADRRGLLTLQRQVARPSGTIQCGAP